MKNSEILAEAYASSKSSSDVFKKAHKEDFIAGFNSGKKLKWNNLNHKLPKSDHHCLIWVENTEKSNWSEFRLRSYQNDKWYLKYGIDYNIEIVKYWVKI